jgi:hypothetical protein
MKAMPENLGEILGGEAIENSGYMLYFLKNEYCKFLNRTVYQKEHIKQFKQAITGDYRVNMIADNLLHFQCSWLLVSCPCTCDLGRGAGLAGRNTREGEGRKGGGEGGTTGANPWLWPPGGSVIDL